jgi:hypothetical protein
MKSDEEPLLAPFLEPEVISHIPTPPSILHFIEPITNLSLFTKSGQSPTQSINRETVLIHKKQQAKKRYRWGGGREKEEGEGGGRGRGRGRGRERERDRDRETERQRQRDRDRDLQCVHSAEPLQGLFHFLL